MPNAASITPTANLSVFSGTRASGRWTTRPAPAISRHAASAPALAANKPPPALAACLLVAGAGLVLHRPLARVPENTLKFAVGVMLSAFGVFWTGEGLGVNWPGADFAIVAFAALFLAISGLAVVLARRPKAEVLP